MSVAEVSCFVRDLEYTGTRNKDVSFLTSLRQLIDDKY